MAPESRPCKESFSDFNLDHKYLIFRRTKIVATLGPASSSPKLIERLIRHGLNVVRINFSHGEPLQHLATIKLVRSIAQKCGSNVAILGDLCGPKIRVGMFENDGVVLKDKTIVTITTKAVLGNERLIPSQYAGIVKEAKVGEQILLDDGNLELRIVKKYSDRLEAKVIHGGLLKNKKGMNLPDTIMKISALTTKDKDDALWCIKGGVDYIALSFVRRAQDITDLRNHLKLHGSDISIIAKIEKPEALGNIHSIIKLADGIMVARGDLGVELPPKKVPLIQNKLIQIAIQANKPVIVATQMLESMIEHSRPTRAEVTDVAGACIAGADAVMLSAETASGKYPFEAFDMMDSILRETEAYQFFTEGGEFRKARVQCTNAVEDALGVATAQLSRDLWVRSIFVLTRSGATARFISSDRPAAPIMAMTPFITVARRLNLLWGVYPHTVSKKNVDIDEYLRLGENIIKKYKLAVKGDYVLMLSGLGDRNLSTNTVVVHQVT